jgi:enoyl-CoA hydratase/carnithine racemase
LRDHRTPKIHIANEIFMTIHTSTLIDPALLAGNRKTLTTYEARHFHWACTNGVATITLSRPERKNPLTFDSYAELRDLFTQLKYATDVHVVVLHGSGGNFCSGGDVHEIIGPLMQLAMPELLMFTRMTGDLIKSMRACPQPIIAAIDGICAGAGAIMAMASDLRLGTARSKTAFLFNRVGLAGCDMGACTILPRLIGQGRASDWLYTGRSIGGEEAERSGFLNRLVDPEQLLADAQKWAHDLASGPTFANGMTKTMLHQEWNMSVDQAIEAEAQAQAICMMTEDFNRAYQAFVAKQKPVFQGN